MSPYGSPYVLHAEPNPPRDAGRWIETDSRECWSAKRVEPRHHLCSWRQFLPRSYRCQHGGPPSVSGFRAVPLAARDETQPLRGRCHGHTTTCSRYSP